MKTLKMCFKNRESYKPIYICNDFPLFFSVFINSHEYANYANKVRCIFDHGKKGLCLSFILVQILVLYD